MRRQEEPRREESLLARLRGLPTPSEHDLRAMARAATSRSRPLPPPVSSRGGLSARGIGVVGLALAAAVALGVGLGTLLAPTGTAANAAVGTGFLPRPGWTVLQSGADATAERQSLAVATNVRLHPEDDARGIRASSGLPYATLLRLPAHGVVIVALFTVREPYPWMDEGYPERELPLRVRDATKPILYSVPVRPERPLGQFELRARVNDHYVDIQFYFGSARPSLALFAVAQRQLDRLVVGSVSGTALAGTRSPTGVRQATKVIDRTLLCEAGDTGGIRQVQVAAQPLIHGAGVTVTTNLLSAWSLGTVSGGGLSLSPNCRGAKRLAFRSSGLSGGVVRFEERYNCPATRRVIVRVRGRFSAPVRLRRGSPYKTPLHYAFAPMEEGQLTVSTESGRRLAYAAVAADKPARLFVAGSCMRVYRR